ncbi:MAG: HD domain-containing protein [Halanaerobiales bacterium]|nr:HD domain-containing protein [Halanaerobiales bacterium]
MLIKDKIPDYAKSVCQKLHTDGFQSYIVGGAPRDIALDLIPKDFDIATNATPDQVETLFEHTIPTGKKYGTITVLLKEKISHTLEVTSFRKDATYTDGRRPDYVTFSDNLIDDLMRRDFTINAIAYDPITDTIHDPFDGLRDIENKLLQTVGSASAKIKEDALRMMRGIRIRAEKGFTMNPSLIDAIKANGHLINNVSPERVSEELCRTILSSRPRQGISDLLKLGLLKFILPELHHCEGEKQREDYHQYDVFGHIAHALYHSKNDIIVRLTVLLHDIGKPPTRTIDKKGIIHFYGHEITGAKMAEKILKRLKFSNKITKSVTLLIRHHMRNVESDKSLRKLMSILITHEQALRFAEVRFADKIAGKQSEDEVYAAYKKLVARINTIWSEKQPLQLSDLCVTGEDVMEVLGVGPGPEIGTILHQLLDQVIANPSLNTHPTLMKLIPELF